MLRLLLLRHAKAVQDSGEGDFDRALSERGRSDAARMGRLLDTRAYLPQFALCSPARRTAETLALLTPELRTAPRAAFPENLYLASAGRLLEAIRTTPRDVRVLMLAGHNPGIENLAAKLARAPEGRHEGERLDLLREKYPTCALAVLDFADDGWNSIAPGNGTLADFIRPRDWKS